LPKPPFPNFATSKMITDCYEFLHLSEIGQGTMRNLVRILGSKKSQKESNHRQIERVKLRCIHTGIKVTFDIISKSFVAPLGSKYKLLELIEAHQQHKPPNPKNFGPFKIQKSFVGE